MLASLLEPFQYSYMLKALGASAIIGTIGALLSAFLILKGWSLIADALSHAVVPGVAIAYAGGFSLTIGALISGLLAAICMVVIGQLAKFKEDAIIGFVFTSFFALGLLIISLNPTAISIKAVIFGNILTLRDSEIYQIIAISAFSSAILLFKLKTFILVFFDENQAACSGINNNLYKIIFFILLSASTVIAMQAVGAILVIAMLIIPGASAYLITDKFNKLLKIAVAIGAGCSVFGTYLSYFLAGSTGGFIVLAQVAVFGLTFLFSPKYGLVMAKLNSRIKKQGKQQLKQLKIEGNYNL